MSKNTSTQFINKETIIEIQKEYTQCKVKLEQNLERLWVEINNFREMFHFEEFQEKPNENTKQELKRREAHFEKIFETATRNVSICNQKMDVHESIENIKKTLDKIFKECEKSQEIIGNKTNEYINKMRNLEETENPELLKSKYHRRNYKNIYIKTKDYLKEVEKHFK